MKLQELLQWIINNIMPADIAKEVNIDELHFQNVVVCQLKPKSYQATALLFGPEYGTLRALKKIGKMWGSLNKKQVFIEIIENKQRREK